MPKRKSKTTTGRKIRFATVWLGGCSGCNMSFLDLGEHLIELVDRVELVYGPLVDVKEYPPDVDVIFVEGSINNTENLHLFEEIRKKTKIVVSFGDCAVTGNVSSLRNPYPVEEVYGEAYNRGPGTPPPGTGADVLPLLLPKSAPIHHVLKADAYIPGCPPEPERIWAAITALLEGKPVQLKAEDRSFG